MNIEEPIDQSKHHQQKSEEACYDVTNFENYQTESILGEGAYGKVYKVLFKPTKKSLALKIFKPVNNLQKLYEKEVDSLKLVKGQKEFVQIFAQLDQFRQKYKGIAMEFCSGGELLKYIMLKKGLGEEDVRTYLHQIVAILEALQAKSLAHLDIKAENFFFDADFNLILGDFGMCEVLTEPNQVINDFRKGSPSYLLLEQLQQNPYRAAHADLFAAAVTIFSIYSCLLPFKQPQQYNVLFNNPRSFWQLLRQNSPNPAFSDHLNKDFVNLFMRMVHPHPASRITLEEIKQHPFYLGEQAVELQQSVYQTLSSVNQNQNTFNAPQTSQIDQNTQLTRGAESASIREQFERYEYNVTNLLNKRAAKMYDDQFSRLSDFKTNINCQTLFEFLFVHQEEFTTELPVLSDKSFKLKCVYQQAEQPINNNNDANHNDVNLSSDKFYDDLFNEEFFKVPIDLNAITINSNNNNHNNTNSINTTETIQFNIVLKADQSNTHTYVDFVRKAGNAFEFFQLVVKIQNLIRSFK